MREVDVERKISASKYLNAAGCNAYEMPVKCKGGNIRMGVESSRVVDSLRTFSAIMERRPIDHYISVVSQYVPPPTLYL